MKASFIPEITSFSLSTSISASPKSSSISRSLSSIFSHELLQFLVKAAYFPAYLIDTLRVQVYDIHRGPDLVNRLEYRAENRDHLIRLCRHQPVALLYRSVTLLNSIDIHGL